MNKRNPIIQTTVSEEMHKKILKLANKEERTLSNYTSIILKNYIQDYEEKIGTIDIEKD